MKARSTPRQGSFGLPPQHQEAIQRYQDQKEASKQEEEKNREGATSEAPPIVSEEAEEKPSEEEKSGIPPQDPKELLKGIGVELTEEDCHQLLFRGFLEKELALVKMKEKNFTVKYKTLTGKEYNYVDELIAKDIDNISMTRAGYERRRNLWILAFAVQELSGRRLTKTAADKGGAPDLKAMARGRFPVIESLAPWVIDELMRVYGVLEVSISLVIKDTEGFFLKKS